MKKKTSHKSKKPVILSKAYPMARRYVFYRSLPWFLVLVAVLATAVFINSSGDPLLFDKIFIKDLDLEAWIFGWAIILVGLVLLLYSEIYRLTCYYAKDGDKLVIRRGVIFREFAFFPLTQITDLYLERDWKALLLGLHNLRICTPSRRSGAFATIDGLSRRNAIALTEKISDFIRKSEQKLPRSDKSETTSRAAAA